MIDALTRPDANDRHVFERERGRRLELPPMDAVGSGSVQEKQQASLAEIIQKVNWLLARKLSDDDQLFYMNGVFKGKLLENETLMRQAASNSKELSSNLKASSISRPETTPPILDSNQSTRKLALPLDYIIYMFAGNVFQDVRY